MSYIVNYNEPILITGSNGFIGRKVVETLLKYGFNNLRCLVRSSKNISILKQAIAPFKNANAIMMEGNLLSQKDCEKATENVSLIYHLAAGTGKSFSGCYMNSVVSTKNLLESIKKNSDFKRFLNVSSIAVLSNKKLDKKGVFNEKCLFEDSLNPHNEAYAYGKIEQDLFLTDFCAKNNIPYVTVRPGVVYGPGKKQIFGMIGIDTFGFFIDIGGSNRFPITYIDNCADAIVLAGIVSNIDGESFIIVDDDLPTCRSFLKLYKKNVGTFFSVYMPYSLFYLFSFIWEKLSDYTKGQLPAGFNRDICRKSYKKVRYSNEKLKKMTGWTPKVPYREAVQKYFEFVKNGVL